MTAPYPIINGIFGLPIPAAKAAAALASCLVALNEATEAINRAANASRDDVDAGVFLESLHDVHEARLAIENALPHVVKMAAEYAAALD